MADEEMADSGWQMAEGCIRNGKSMTFSLIRVVFCE